MDSIDSIISNYSDYYSGLLNPEPNLIQISSLKKQEKYHKEALKRLSKTAQKLEAGQSGFRVATTPKKYLLNSASEEVYKPGQAPFSLVKFRNSQNKIIKRLCSPHVATQEVILFQDKNLEIVEIRSYCKQRQTKYLKISLRNKLDVLFKITDKKVDFADVKRDSEHKYSEIKAREYFIYILGKDIFEAVKSGNTRIYVSRLIAHLTACKDKREGKLALGIKDREVHHINENPLDNRCKNLIALSKDIHERIHELKQTVRFFQIIDFEIKRKNKKKLEQLAFLIAMNKAGIINLETEREARARRAKEDLLTLNTNRVMWLIKGHDLIRSSRTRAVLAPKYDELIFKSCLAVHEPSPFTLQEIEAFKGQVRGRVGDYFRSKMFYYDRKSKSWNKAITQEEIALALGKKAKLTEFEKNNVQQKLSL